MPHLGTLRTPTIIDQTFPCVCVFFNQDGDTLAV